MKALVIGYGSIGQRHVGVLEKIGFSVDVVSRRLTDNKSFYTSIEQAFTHNNYVHVVISNETSRHIDALKQLVDINYTGNILIEKPLFMNNEVLSFDDSKTYVAYNLRFHPLIMKLKEELINERPISVNSYVGQYLPEWRPGVDYSKSYSAFSNQGGGVLRDLSHELDYLYMLFGEWKSLVSDKAKISNLNIQSEDYVNIKYITENNIHVAVELNYLDRITQRYIIVQTLNKTIKVDLIHNTLNSNGDIKHFNKVERDYTYVNQHLSIINGDNQCCSYKEGLKVVNMIEAIEKSSYQKVWVDNG